MADYTLTLEEMYLEEDRATREDAERENVGTDPAPAGCPGCGNPVCAGCEAYFSMITLLTYGRPWDPR